MTRQSLVPWGIIGLSLLIAFLVLGMGEREDVRVQGLTSRILSLPGGKEVQGYCCGDLYIQCITDKCIPHAMSGTQFERCAFQCERSGFLGYPSRRACLSGKVSACIVEAPGRPSSDARIPLP